MLSNCGAKDFWDSLGLQGDQTSQFWRKSSLNIHWIYIYILYVYIIYIIFRITSASLILKLKLQYFGHRIRRADTLGKTLMLGKIEGRRRRGQQRRDCGMASPIQWTWTWQTPGDGEGEGGLVCCSPWAHRGSDMTWRLNDNNSDAQ